MSQVPPISHPCTVCCRATTNWCSRCKNTWYCSPEHLNRDWQRHRRECTPAKGTQQATISAILFEPGAERSRIITVQCSPQGIACHGMCPTPMVQELFPESNPPHTIILTQGLNGEPLRYPLHIWYCPTSLRRGYPENCAIHRITSGVAANSWCGPVVVLKFNGSRRSGYSDAGSNDLPALSAYFLQVNHQN